MKKNKEGISLIVLVITVIVLGILAGVVIASINETNIVEQTTNTVFKSDIQSYRELYNVYLVSYMAENNGNQPESLNVAYGDAEFTEIFGEVPEKYQTGLKVINGEFAFITTDEAKIEVLTELGVKYTE